MLTMLTRTVIAIAFFAAVATSPAVVVVPSSQTVYVVDRLAPAILPLPRRRRR